MRRPFLVALLLLVVLTGCSRDLSWRAVDQMIQSNFPDVSTITSDSLATRLADSTQARPVLLDTRSPEEYAVSHLRGARRVPPDTSPLPELDALPRDTAIVVYCSVGYRSARVATHLREQGFTNVANLRGSIFRWANEGRPVVRGDSVVRAVHPYNDTWGTLLDADLHRRSPPLETGPVP
jgi:rhodanese-related sulfurtransferase